jgi:hypothetical protein
MPFEPSPASKNPKNMHCFWTAEEIQCWQNRERESMQKVEERTEIG